MLKNLAIYSLFGIFVFTGCSSNSKSTVIAVSQSAKSDTDGVVNTTISVDGEVVPGGEIGTDETEVILENQCGYFLYARQENTSIFCPGEKWASEHGRNTIQGAIGDRHPGMKITKILRGGFSYATHWPTYHVSLKRKW